MNLINKYQLLNVCVYSAKVGGGPIILAFRDDELQALIRQLQ
jgi:hypothetical protein